MPRKTLATVTVAFKNPSPEKLDAAAKAAYDGFMRESGHDKNALVPEYAKQPEPIKERWRRMALDVLKAAMS